MKVKRFFEFLCESEDFKNASWSYYDPDRAVDITITIGDLLHYLKDVEVVNILVSDISDMGLYIHKDVDFSKEQNEKTDKRVQRADLKYPIIISKTKDGYNRILDGHHRLQKSINIGEKFIKAKVLDLEEAPIEYQNMFR